MRTAPQVWESIKDIFINFPNHWTIVLEVILFFAVIYFVFKTLAENNALKLIPIYVLAVVTMGVIALFADSSQRTTMSIVFYFVIFGLALLLLILFSVEIKRSIWKSHRSISTSVVSSAKAKTETRMSAVRTEEIISAIVKAVLNLAKANIGALIVLSNGNLPKEILDSGVALNSAISSQLIEGIFIPKAPLHDGAMIINGDKIQAAGCFLPLTQRDFPKDYGTRHRAGIGVTEAADVATIIISEETGIVSVVKRGEITRYVDSESLKRFLRNYYWKDFNGEGKKS